MFACPKCDGDTHVIDTRKTRRRRECKSCGFRFFTEELIEGAEGDGFIKVPVALYDAVKELTNIIEKDKLLKTWGIVRGRRECKD